jgi:hypothetical protein
MMTLHRNDWWHSCHTRTEGETAADNDIVPTPLQNSLIQSNQDELIPLACKYYYITWRYCPFLFVCFSFVSLMAHLIVSSIIWAGMNVVMPTATSSMHTDPELIVASKQTAERGIRVLSILLDNPITKRNCVAIYAASSGKQVNADADLVKVRTSNYQMETCQT